MGYGHVRRKLELDFEEVALKPSSPRVSAYASKRDLRAKIPQVTIKGYDKKLGDHDIKRALTNHFSSCGEVLHVGFGPLGYNRRNPNRYASMFLRGEDAADKAELLNGSYLGRCKLVVKVFCPAEKPKVPSFPLYMKSFL